MSTAVPSTQAGMCLSSPHKKIHPLKKMRLGIFKVSGNPLLVEACRENLQISSSLLGEIQPKNNIGRISRNGCYVVSKGTLINLIPI